MPLGQRERRVLQRDLERCWVRMETTLSVWSESGRCEQDEDEKKRGNSCWPATGNRLMCRIAIHVGASSAYASYW